MTEKYNSYVFNKISQYKDSDALRIASLGLATLEWRGIFSFSPSYWITNTSYNDLIIKEIIATYTVNDDIYDVWLDNGTPKQLFGGFNQDMPAVFNESNFSGTVADRTIPKGSQSNYRYLEWLHGGSSSAYGTTMSVEFTNGTKLFAEAPGYMHSAPWTYPGTYAKFTVTSYWGTDVIIEKIRLTWPGSNVALLMAEIEGVDKDHFYDDLTMTSPSTFGKDGFEFEGSIDNVTLEPDISSYVLSFFFGNSTLETGYTLELWFDTGEYVTWSN